MKPNYIPPRCRIIQLDGCEFLSASPYEIEGNRLRVTIDETPMTSGSVDSNTRVGGSSIWPED